jgi:PRTRC genetic system protein B
MITSATNLQSSQSYTLDVAFLVYRNFMGDAFATHHNVLQSEDHQPVLGAGQLVTAEQISALISQFYQTSAVFIEPHILGYAADFLCWHEPAQARAMHFKSKDATLEALNGQPVPQPPLLFVAHQQKLQIYALESDARPTLESPLYRAPYFNTYQDGNVCLGSTPVPTLPSPVNAGKYSQAYFASQFTHASGNTKLASFEGSHSQMWHAAQQRGAFSTEWLIPSTNPKTVADLFAPRGRHAT